MTELSKFKMCELLKAYELIGNEIYKQWGGNVPTGKEKPPKEWWDNCMSRAGNFASDPEKYCGALWFHGPSTMRESFGKGGVEKMSEVEKEDDIEKEKDKVVKPAGKPAEDEVQPQEEGKPDEEKKPDEETEKMDEGEVTPSTQADVLQQILEAIKRLETAIGGGSGEVTTEPEPEAGTSEEVKMSDVSKTIKEEIQKQFKELGITKTETANKPKEVKKVDEEILKGDKLAKMTWQEVENYVEDLKGGNVRYW